MGASNLRLLTLSESYVGSFRENWLESWQPNAAKRFWVARHPSHDLGKYIYIAEGIGAGDINTSKRQLANNLII
jgi:hypothetical protein